MDLTALFKVNYGMYIVSSCHGEKRNGQIANTMFQITSEPPTVAVSINKQNLTHELIAKSRIYSVAVLSEEAPMTYIGQFGFKSGRDIDKFAGIEVRTGTTGCPVPLPYALAMLEAEVTAEFDCGTHTLFLGRVVNAENLGSGTPMTYAHYHEVKRGKSPQTAPTYIKVEPKVVAPKHKCEVCGYVYDEALGDPTAHIAPGTRFEGLPDNWVCPVCGVDASNFSKETAPATQRAAGT